MTDQLRVGVLGLGAVAQAVHLPLLAKRPDLARIAAICDLSSEVLDAMGDRYGVPAGRRFLRLEDMLDAGGLDTVMILARGTHAPAVLAVWGRGLPVFCEKPLAYTLAEADELIRTEPDLGHPSIMVGYMKQYDPAVVQAARLLADVDDIRLVDVTVLHPPGSVQLEVARLVKPTRPLPEDVATAIATEDDALRLAALGDTDTDTWRTYRGALVSSLAHDLSIMRSFDVPPLTVEHAAVWRQRSAHQVRDSDRDRGSFGDHPPSISAAGSLATGGRYQLGWHFLPDYPAYRESVRVVHGAGCLELTFPSPYLLHAPTELTVTTLDGDAERRTVHRSVTEAFEEQLEAFVAMVRDGTPPRTGLAGSRADIADCQRIVAAAAAGQGKALGGEAALLAGSVR